MEVLGGRTDLAMRWVRERGRRWSCISSRQWLLCVWNICICMDVYYIWAMLYTSRIYVYAFPPGGNWVDIYPIHLISYTPKTRSNSGMRCDERERNSISIPQHSPLPPPAPLSAALLPSQSPSLSAAARPPPRASSTWLFGAASVALLSAGWDIFFAGRDGQGSGPIDRAGGRRVGRSSSFLWREGK